MSEKYQFIDAEYAGISAADADSAPTITCMCKWLGVWKSGFYDWRSRPESATARRRELLKIKIKALFEANDSTYGYRRMHAALVRGGEQAGPELVRQLMRELVGVPELSHRSWPGLLCGSFVFVDEAAEDGPTLDAFQRRVRNGVIWPGRVELAAAMRSPPVVVGLILS